MPRITTGYPLATSVSDSDEVVIIQGGNVKRATISNLPTIQGDTGATGEPGEQGPPGTTVQFYTGTGAPSDAVGVENDWYIRTTTGDWYKKGASTWGSPVFNSTGPQGATGDDGPTGPSGGSAGDFTPAGTGAVVRTMNTKMKEVQLSLKDYGFATGNSASTNKTAWDNCVAACKAADADMFIPPGTYSITNVVHDKQVNIFGNGRMTTQLNITTTSTHGFVVKQDTEFDSGTMIILKGFTINGSSATLPTGYFGFFIQAKVIMDGVDIEHFNRTGMAFAPNNASVSGGLKGTIGNAPFFSIIRNVRSRYNDGHGCWMRMGANVTHFEYCSFSNNGQKGFYHFNDSPDDNGDNGSTYGTVIIGGQASYNEEEGYYFESGTNITSYGTYAEYNGSPTRNNSNAYTNTTYDYYFGNNIVRTMFVIGVLLNANAARVRTPPTSNTTCYIYEGGRALSAIIPKRAGTVATFNGTTVAAINTQLNTAFATLRAANICG